MDQKHSRGSRSSKTMGTRGGIQSSPEVFLDQDNDFASIRLLPGVEAKSYVKDGFVFLEDKRGRVIEIQILNLSRLAESLKQPA